MTGRRLLIALVGIPGSGKSRVADGAATANVPVVCADAVRAELLGDETDQGQADRVWAEVHGRLADHLTRGSVLLDATNLVPVYRAPLLGIARAAGALPVAWRLTTPHKTSRRANWHRERVVPDAVMDRMVGDFNRYCTPDVLAAEGWTVCNVAGRTGPARVAARMVFGEAR